ncbi:hypothetical protein PR048_008563 [Dryococelus australis]|uniref:Uncharacterized protein n=1 Tax=Dryococelus australis TaxID=614101 RepID=A0ABQ9HXG5_9NEOP|nr:hypothetical protein PR048_008563 [Dryococelus australis]
MTLGQRPCADPSLSTSRVYLTSVRAMWLVDGTGLHAPLPWMQYAADQLRCALDSYVRGGRRGAGNSVAMEAEEQSGGGGGPDEGYLLVRVHVPELNVQKCLQFPRDQLVWDVKQQCLAALPKWLGRSPPTTATRARYPAGSLPDFRMWESCWTMPLAGGFPLRISVSSALAFQRRSILASHFMSCSGMTGTYGSQLESPSLGDCCLALGSLPTRFFFFT